MPTVPEPDVRDKQDGLPIRGGVSTTSSSPKNGADQSPESARQGGRHLQETRAYPIAGSRQ